MTRFPGSYSGLTVKQAELLSFLRYEDQEGRSPSYREIQDALDISSIGHIAGLLNGLKERGYVSFIPNRARAIKLLDRDAVQASTMPIEMLLAELKRRGVVLETAR